MDGSVDLSFEGNFFRFVENLIKKVVLLLLWLEVISRNARLNVRFLITLIAISKMKIWNNYNRSFRCCNNTFPGLIRFQDQEGFALRL